MKKNLLAFAAFAFAAIGLHNCTPENQVSTTVNQAKLVLPTTEYDYKAGIQAFMNDLPTLSAGRIDTASFNNTAFFTNGFFLNGNTRFAVSSSSVNPVEIKNEVATLGRVLFYDKQLSINNTIACGSCHLQSKAFSDVEDGSNGFKGTKTPRNSMSIANPVLTSNLFWDSRSKSLDDMVLKPVQNHIEMGMENLNFLASKLQKVAYYPALFKKAFNTEEVTSQEINIALKQFLASMVTHNSKFDIGLKSKFSNYTQLELVGKDLFMSERLSCTKCHTGANLSLGDEISGGSMNPYGGTGGSEGTANVGLDMVYKDNGRGNGKFKIPSLRNIELTAPYMHDGRFKTLEQVVEHYNSGIQAHPNLDANLKTDDGSPRRLNLSPIEKTALIAFLKTLTDYKYTTDVKYSDPFQN